MVFLVSFNIIKLGWICHFFMLLPIIRSLLGMFLLQWNRTMPHYWRIWCHHKWTGDRWSHLPYHGWGSPLLVLGVPSTTANKWFVFSKLNIRLVFEYFSSLALPVGERPHSYFLHAFYLCALARYFLVQKSYCVDLWMCMVAYELKKGNLVGLILAKTLNGLDAFHRKKASFFAGSSLLL